MLFQPQKFDFSTSLALSTHSACILANLKPEGALFLFHREIRKQSYQHVVQTLYDVDTPERKHGSLRGPRNLASRDMRSGQISNTNRRIENSNGISSGIDCVLEYFSQVLIQNLVLICSQANKERLSNFVLFDVTVHH